MSSDAEDQARDKAWFCLALGIAPSEYDQMTDLEIDVFLEVAEEIREKRDS